MIFVTFAAACAIGGAKGVPPHVASFAVVLLLAPIICGWPHAAGRSAEASVYPAAMSSAPIAITNAIRGAEDGFAFDCIAALLYVSGEEEIVLLILPFFFIFRH